MQDSVSILSLVPFALILILEHLQFVVKHTFHIIKVPDNLGPGSYKLKVQGIHGLMFTNETNLYYESKSVSIFIQTDRAIYKPGSIGIPNKDIFQFKIMFSKNQFHLVLTGISLKIFLIVHFRAFAIYPNMSIFSGSMDIVIYVSIIPFHWILPFIVRYSFDFIFCFDTR